MPNTSDSTTPLKRCSKGDKCVHPMGCMQPATAEYFYRDNYKPDGFCSGCKACARKSGEAGREKRREYVREWASKNREKTREYCRSWYARNIESERERERKKREANPDKHREKVRLSNIRNRAKRSAYDRQHAINNPEKYRAKQHRRKALKRGLPATFTSEHAHIALDYFNGCCAVCGRQLRDLFATHTIAFDHWIPLSKGGGSTPDNMLPLCHGLNGCNNHKSDKDPVEWIFTTYNKTQAKQILARIQAYFDSLKD